MPALSSSLSSPGLAPAPHPLTWRHRAPRTATSVNPARSIGPALFAGTAALSQLWVFIVMPVVGGVLGALAYQTLFSGAPAVATETSADATETSADATETSPGRQRRHRGRRDH